MSNKACQTYRRNRPTWRRKRARRGAATLWIILWIPAVLCLLGTVVETGNLLLARIELTNALEAGALSGADEWGDSGVNTSVSRTAARDRAVALIESNTMTATSLRGSVSKNVGVAGVNENLVCTGNVVILGAADTGMLDFDASIDPMAAGQDFAVRVQATVSVNSIIGTFCGVAVGPFSVTAEATARYDGGATKLYSPTSVTCPGP
jgi:Flp pilus assembly protein TadG